MSRMNQQWRLVSRPRGRIAEDDFQWHQEPIGELGPDEVLVRTVYLSLDPSNRIWAGTLSLYMPPVELDQVMRGVGLGVVEESRHPDFVAGDVVAGLLGWQTYAALPGAHVHKLPRSSLPWVAHMAVLNHIGATAYFGLLDVAGAREGDTVVVSAAAGAVGSLAGQIAKIHGCRVIGIAGSDEKCRWITEELGFDGAINYKTQNVAARLDALCPAGIDVDFENVGGAIFDAVLERINLGARIALCGLISMYNATAPEPGPYHFNRVLLQRARIQGFVIMDYQARYPEAMGKLAEWLAQGRIRYRYDMIKGLDNAPRALDRLFTGANIGKLLVKVSDEPA
jgi:NADPH-dependent curcumin reductase